RETRAGETITMEMVSGLVVEYDPTAVKSFRSMVTDAEDGSTLVVKYEQIIKYDPSNRKGIVNQLIAEGNHNITINNPKSNKSHTESSMKRPLFQQKYQTKNSMNRASLPLFAYRSADPPYCLIPTVLPVVLSNEQSVREAAPVVVMDIVRNYKFVNK
ncbi:hypothetical protein M8C21_001569, partial [Ambrosia artemisiifolia]